MALATLTQLKAHLGISGTTDDAKLTRILAGVEMAIARHCRRVWAQANGFDEATVTEVLTPISPGTTLLSVFPVVSVTSVKEDADRLFTDAALVEDTDYLIDKQSGILHRLDASWPRGQMVVKAVYVGGYESAGASHVSGHYAMPADLTSAAIIQAAFEYKRSGQEGIASMAAGGGNVTMYQPEGLLPGVKKLIEPFRRIL